MSYVLSPTMATSTVAKIVFRSRNLAAGLPLLYAFFATRWAWQNTAAVWTLAAALCVLGVAVRSWSAMYCGYGSGEHKTLARGGPYRLVRNPLYWGNILLILAGVAASRLVWLIPLAALWSFAVFHAVVRGEEGRLQRRFGAPYVEYLESVPRWFPRALLAAAPLGDALGPRHGAARVARQLTGFLVLVPFLVKELNLCSLWSHATGS